MANTWGSLSWNVGNFGEQANATVTLTGFGLTSQAANVTTNQTVDFGWSNNAWGETSWNTNEIDAVAEPTGVGLNSNTGNVGISGEINAGWGRLTWGENGWGIAGDVAVTGIGLSAGFGIGSVIVDVENAVTGQQLNFSLNSISLDISASPGVTGQALEISIASVDTVIDAPVSVTGIGLTSVAGTLDGYNETGWGRDEWGLEVWGGSGIWANVPVTGQQQNLTLASVTVQANSDVDATGQQLNTSLGDTTEIGESGVDVTGLGLEFSLETPSITGDANVEIDNGGSQAVPFEALADAQISTAQSKFGGSSLLLDGTDDRIRATEDVQLGTGNFTWETFAYFNNFDSSICIWDGGENVGLNGNPVVYITSTNLQLSFAGGTYINAAHGMSASTWHHIAITRNSGTLTAYIDGTSIGTAAIGAINCPASQHVLGGNWTGTFAMDGYLDESRLTRRVIYTGNFTPPTSAFTPDEDTDFWVLHYDGANGSTNIVNSVPGDTVNLIALTTTTGSATGLPETIASVTEVSLNIFQGTTGAGASADVSPTGQSVVISLGNEVGQAWKEVDTGDTVAYTEVSTGTAVSWSDVDTAA